MITIKKYPNRRLYDTTKSQYVNLEAIKELVMLHKEFTVVDSKTGEDLTQSILLQIITEQESNDHQAILTQTVLKQLIRFYGSDMQGFMSQYLEQSVSAFLERQDVLQDVVTNLMDTAPLNVFKQIAESNMSLWRNFSPVDASPKQSDDAGSAPSDKKPRDEGPAE